MAKKTRNGLRLYLARDSVDNGDYLFMVGMRTHMMVANDGFWHAYKESTQLPTMCRDKFEKACPHLKLKPGEIRELAPPRWKPKMRKRKEK